MADLPEQEAWEGVRQLETSDRALGGPGGVMNVPLRNLANRTAYLKKTLEGKTGAASTTTAGIVKLSSAVDSASVSDAATSAAVKAAYDAAIAAGSNANGKLSKTANLSDIPNIPEALQNLGLVDMVVPVGVPLPWPASIPPSGWLKCNGASFNKSQYPQLATVYPSGTLPDLRSEFIRGWDDGRGIDVGRGLLSRQGATAFTEYHGDGNSYGSSNNPPRNYYADADGVWYAGSGFSAFGIPSGAVGSHQVAGIANFISVRPRNVAFNYIVRAA